MNLNDSFSRSSNQYSHHPSLPVISTNNQYNNNSRDGTPIDQKRARIRVIPPSRENSFSLPNNNENSFYVPRRNILNPLLTDPNDTSTNNRASSATRKKTSKTWLEMLHDKSDKPGTKVSIPELRQKMDEATPDENLMEMNKRLQDDLATLTENYMKVFVEYSSLQEEYKEVLIRKNNKLKQYKEDFYAKKLEVDFLKKQLEEKEKNETVLKMDFESRIQRLRDDLAIEREERASLLEKLTELKTKVHEYNKKGKSLLQDKGDLNPREKFELEEKVNSLTIELEMNRNRLMEKQLKLEEEKVIREETMKISRRICRFGRIHFIGEAKPMEEIFGALEKLNTLPLASKERLLALEELCIYLNSTTEAAEKLSLMGATVPCAKSLSSQDSAIVLRAAHLLSYLCQGRPNCAKQVIENGGVTNLKSCLVSTDEAIRVEAMATLAAVSPLQEAISLIIRDSGVSKILTMVEEGLQSNNEVGIELTKQSIQTLMNIAKASYGIKEIQMYGGVFSLFRTMTCDNIALKRVAVQCLGSCTLDPKYKPSFTSAKFVSLLISLFEKKDARLANDVAKVLGNISDLSSVKETLKYEGGLKSILSLLSREENDLTLILLRMILNIVQDRDIARSACSFGLVRKADKLIRSGSYEVRKYASRSLYLLSGFEGISKDYISPSINLFGIFENLDFEDNLDSARACYGILNNLLKAAQKPEIIEKGGLILPNAAKMLESSIPVNQMKECIKLLSSLMRFQKNRKKIFSLKMDITVVRLLKRVLDLSEKDSDTVIISILQFIGVLVEEEFQTLSPNQQGGQDNEAKTKKNKIILQNCVENEGLLEVLLIVLQKYSLKEKLNWDVLKAAIYALETLSHNPQYVERLISKGLVRQVMQVLEMSEEAKKKSVIASVISILVFYTHKETEWLNICRSYLARILCGCLRSNDKFIKGRAKTCLYDLSFCLLFTKAINELIVEEGLKPLIEAYQKDEGGIREVLVNLAQDVTFRVKLRSFLPPKLLVMANGKDVEGSAFLREIANENKYKVNRRILYTTKQLMDEGYVARKRGLAAVVQDQDKEEAEDLSRRSGQSRTVELLENTDIPLNYMKYYEPVAEVNASEEGSDQDLEEEEDSQPNSPIYQNYNAEDEDEDEEEDDEEGEDDDEDDEDEDDEEEDLVSEENVNKRKEVTDAQREFLDRNGQGNWLPGDDKNQQAKINDLGTTNEYYNKKGNPWDKLIYDEAKKIRDAYNNGEGEEEEEEDEGEGDEDGEYQEGVEEEYDEGEEGDYENQDNGQYEEVEYQEQLEGQEQGQNPQNTES